MSLIGRPIQWNKHCFTYCGPERCDCGASASPLERSLHEGKPKIQIVLKVAEEKTKDEGDQDVKD